MATQSRGTHVLRETEHCADTAVDLMQVQYKMVLLDNDCAEISGRKRANTNNSAIMRFILLLPALFALSNAARCVFPFKYRGIQFDECTDMNSNFLWCSPSYEYSGLSVPCHEDEERQKQLRDNFNGLFDKLEEHTNALEDLEKNKTDDGENKCSNCEAELVEMQKLMPRLTSVASDHERRIAAYSEELDRQVRHAERLLRASKKIQERAMLVTRRRVTRKWSGTAPFCKGSCPGGYRQIKRSNSGDGKSCWTGSKAYCERVYYV